MSERMPETTATQGGDNKIHRKHVRKRVARTRVREEDGQHKNEANKLKSMGQAVSSDICLNDDSCGVMQCDCRTLMAFSAPEA